MADEIYSFSQTNSARVARAVRRVESDGGGDPGLNDKQLRERTRWLVKVVSRRDGAGQFEGRLIKPPSADFDADVDLTLAALGAEHTPTGDATVLVVCLADAGLSRWSLEVGRVYPCDILRRQTDRQLVVAVEGPGEIDIEIVDWTRNADIWQWTYELKRVSPPDAPFGEWPEPATGTLIGFNRDEKNNTSADPGMQSGIPIDSVSGPYIGILPAHVGHCCRATPHTQADGSVVYYFSFQNQPDVLCGGTGGGGGV